MREDKKFLQKIKYNINAEEICRERTENCLKWYTKKAVFYKYAYYCLSIINVVIPILVSILLSNFDERMIGVILSAIASLSAALLALFNVREKWMIYRTAAEYIKSQYTLYCAKASPYNNDNCHHSYISAIEKYMNDVHGKWYILQNATNRNDNAEKNGGK